MLLTDASLPRARRLYVPVAHPAGNGANLSASERGNVGSHAGGNCTSSYRITMHCLLFTHHNFTETHDLDGMGIMNA
jgi:hypothetical protein